MVKELGVFIDESGDFGDYDHRAPYYIISMVFHDQSKDISEPLRYLENNLKQIGFTRNCVHIGPLIRREEEYLYLEAVERARILRKMMNFAAKADFQYKTFTVEKKHIGDIVRLTEKLAGQITDFIRVNLDFFTGYDVVKIYYDNGQVDVTKIVVSVFRALLSKIDFRKAAQVDYRLLQVADLVCTAELTRLKMEAHMLSKSELRVLGTEGDIQKFLLKPLKKKEFKE